MTDYIPAYNPKRHDKSDAVRYRHPRLYPTLYEREVKLKYLPRKDERDLKKGIDLYVDDTPAGERLREAFTEEGKNLCVLNDITVRTKSKDGKPLEMYTSEAQDFVYAIENEGKTGICRAYVTDMQGIKEHYRKGHFSCREIKNKDGNYFVPIDVDELDKFGLIKKRYPPKPKVVVITTKRKKRIILK